MVVAGSYVESTTVPCDGILHRWWRIRNYGAVTYLETSADGASWVTGMQNSSPWPVNSMGLGLSLIVWETASVPAVSVEFDNVNLLPLDTP